MTNYRGQSEKLTLLLQKKAPQFVVKYQSVKQAGWYIQHSKYPTCRFRVGNNANSVERYINDLWFESSLVLEVSNEITDNLPDSFWEELSS